MFEKNFQFYFPTVHRLIPGTSILSENKAPHGLKKNNSQKFRTREKMEFPLEFFSIEPTDFLYLRCMEGSWQLN
jgi:hypothetical protein